MRATSPRIAIFTHDTFGLGHVRRCLHIVRALAEARPDAAILFITGSPALHAFEGLPPNADVVKIPTVAKTGAKRLRPPHLPIPLAEVAALRRELIRQAVAGFAPDVFLVDNFPLGSQGELLPTLQEMRRLSTRTVLGLRDILDLPETVRAEWGRERMYDVLDRYYDRVLVYGMREVFDIAAAYAVPDGVAERIRYCGYVTGAPAAGNAVAAARAELGVEGPFLLATGGGGGDAFPLLSTFAEALRHLPPVPAVVVTGPLMKDSLRADLLARLDGRADVIVRAHVPDFRRYVAAASVVVAMCGYNTAAEIVAQGARAVVVPRTWRYGEHLKREEAGVEGEQRMRGEAFARLGLVDLLPPSALTPEGLAERIAAVLARDPAPASLPVDLGGLEVVRDQLLELAQAAGRPDGAC
jgi:predicted glycosyltransferase